MDDDPPRRPSRAQTGTERDIQGMAALRNRQHRIGTQSDGTPRQVDNDVTPEPAVLPRRITRDELERLPLPDQVRALSELSAQLVAASAQNAKAIAYEQDQRNEARRHGEALAVLSEQMERVGPALERAHETAVIVDEMRADVRSLGGNVGDLVRAHDRDEERRKVEGDRFDRVLAALGATDERTRAAAITLEVLSERVDTLDKSHAETRGRVATGEVKVTHLDKRVAITRARLGKGDKALVGGGFVGAGVIGHYVSDLITWIGNHIH